MATDPIKVDVWAFPCPLCGAVNLFAEPKEFVLTQVCDGCRASLRYDGKAVEVVGTVTAPTDLPGTTPSEPSKVFPGEAPFTFTCQEEQLRSLLAQIGMTEAEYREAARDILAVPPPPTTVDPHLDPSHHPASRSYGAPTFDRAWAVEQGRRIAQDIVARILTSRRLTLTLEQFEAFLWRKGHRCHLSRFDVEGMKGAEQPTATVTVVPNTPPGTLREETANLHIPVPCDRVTVRLTVVPHDVYERQKDLAEEILRRRVNEVCQSLGVPPRVFRGEPPPPLEQRNITFTKWEKEVLPPTTFDPELVKIRVERAKPLEAGKVIEVVDKLVVGAEAQYVYCHACSKAGAADAPVYHEPPVCEDADLPTYVPRKEE